MQVLNALCDMFFHIIVRMGWRRGTMLPRTTKRPMHKPRRHVGLPASREGNDTRNTEIAIPASPILEVSKGSYINMFNYGIPHAFVSLKMIQAMHDKSVRLFCP
jgi:hypothetical protein